MTRSNNRTAEDTEQSTAVLDISSSTAFTPMPSVHLQLTDTLIDCCGLMSSTSYSLLETSFHPSFYPSMEPSIPFPRPSSSAYLQQRGCRVVRSEPISQWQTVTARY